MSHITQINYQQIEIQCNSICELANEKSNELDEMIKQLKNSSTTLYNNAVEALLKEIKAEQAELLNQIKKVQDVAKENGKKGVQYGSYETARLANSLVEEANKLHDQINELSSSKLIEYRALLDQLLGEQLRKRNEMLYNKVEGKVIYTDEFKNLIESIKDNLLKHYVNIAYIQDSTLSNDQLIVKAKELMNESYEDRVNKQRKQIIEELQKLRFSNKTIDKIKNVNTGNSNNDIRTINEIANKEIIDEKVRKKSLIIIKKAIEARGFIVDKNNIKIDKEKNEVNMLALKPSGEKAQFKVYLDGRFIYDFHGYEGQACQKDIEPFMTALEEVYGMKVISKEDIWSNPDKISSMKYQQMNYNKNKG